jgi:hypothetical protein
LKAMPPLTQVLSSDPYAMRQDWMFFCVFKIIKDID